MFLVALTGGHGCAVSQGEPFPDVAIVLLHNIAIEPSAQSLLIDSGVVPVLYGICRCLQTDDQTICASLELMQQLLADMPEPKSSQQVFQQVTSGGCVPCLCCV